MPDPVLTFHIAQPLNDEGVVWKRKVDKNRFLQARDGDMWLSSFQCHHCWFINLKKSTPVEGRMVDERLMGYIKQANLDMFWSRAPKTVYTNFLLIKKEIRLSLELGLNPIHVIKGPWPLGDCQGMQLSLVILRASQEKGRYQDTHQQFDSIRRIRTAHYHAYASGIEGGFTSCVFQGDKGKNYSLSSTPTNSLAFSRFMEGLESRMGKEVRQQKGLRVEVLKAIMNNMEEEMEFEREFSSDWRNLVVCGAFFSMMYGCSLRGNEGMMLERQGLCNYIKTGKTDQMGHVVLPLLGRFKGETGERLILLVMANESKSGLRFRWWTEQLVKVLKHEGWDTTAGPGICSSEGEMMSSHDLNDEFIKQMKRVQEETTLIPEAVEVGDKFGTYRSFRVGSNTRARESKVEPEIIKLIHRWSLVEKKGTSVPSFEMIDHYLDISQVLDSYLSYSKSL